MFLKEVINIFNKFRINKLFKKAIEENIYIDLWNDNQDYKVITLCGSTKFKDEFEYWNSRLTLEGNVVFSCGVFDHAEGIELSKEDKKMLDNIHKRKIDMSNEIFIIDKDNYIGQSTRNEIEYALKNNKKVDYASNYHVYDLVKDNGFL